MDSLTRTETMEDFRMDLRVILKGEIPQCRYWPSKPPPVVPLRREDTPSQK